MLDPNCSSDACPTFKAGHEASQTQISWASQFLYGHYTLWFFLVALFLAMLSYALNLLPRSTPKSPSTTSLREKAVATIRRLSYRHFRGRFADACGLPGWGMLAFLLVAWLYLLLLTFVERPYYRKYRAYGSPPLAVRTGLMATALTPVIVALAGKVNFVTMLTGISHERLNVLHRWTSYMCLFLSTVHTVPFIVAPLRDGGAAQLRKQYYKPGALEFTGTPPLGMLVGLCVLSIPQIRHRWYTLFYRLHIPLYVVYLGTMFWHSTQEGDSWAYLWATLAIWLASVAGRAFTKWQAIHVQRSWFSGFPARLNVLEGGMTRVDVEVPDDLEWSPGQHCWVRFTHLSLLHNHPFTIASIHVPSSKESRSPMIQFYIRTYRGLTHALAASAEKDGSQTCTAHIDGPYGGVTGTLAYRFDELVFIAGGAGVSACLPFLLETARLMEQGPTCTQTMHLVWMVRLPVHLQWVREELDTITQLVGHGKFHVHFFVTESAAVKSTTASSGKDTELGTSPTSSSPTELASVRHERPFLPDLVPSLLTGRRILLFGCGPESLKADISNAAARAQRRVLAGEANEILLHNETFGW